MNVAEIAELSLFPAKIEAIKATLEIAQEVENAIVAAEESGVIEDTAEISDIAQKLFSLEV
ncbi:MAG: hypothetical protein ACI4SM_02860 [Candidatus Gastranaerophilaceae bacterium]